MRSLHVSIILALALLAGCTKPVPPIDPVMQRYEDVRLQVSQRVRTQNPRAALEYFGSVIDDPLVAKVCHGLAHEIGREAYEKYGFEEALAYEDDICGSGYTHGIIETHFANIENPVASLTTLCQPTAGKCFHGLGHGLMYASENDLPTSLDHCKTLDERFQKIQCAEGVFMENFNTDMSAHATEFLRADDPFYPCRYPEEPYKGVCAFYAPRFYIKQQPGAYVQALRWCTTVGDGPDDACAKGVGSVAMKENIGSPAMVEAICDQATAEQEPYCIEGLVSYYIVHYASAEKGRGLCLELTDEHRSRCEKIVAESEKFYGE